MSETPSEPQNNEDTVRAIAEQNADLVGYIQEYQQRAADEQFTNIQLRRRIMKLEATVSELERRLAASGQGEGHAE
jgi:phage shock protein A